VGRLRAGSRRTGDEAETAFVVIHYGGLDFHTVLRQPPSPHEFEDFKRRLVEAYRTGSLADVTALVTREFDGRTYRLDGLFADEQRRIINIILQDRVEDYHRTFERLARQDDDVLNRLGQLGHPIPKPMRAAASSYLDHRLLQELARLESDGGPEVIKTLQERRRTWGCELDSTLLATELSQALQRTVGGLVDPASDLPGLVAKASQLLDAGALVGIAADLWEIQNQLLDAYRHLSNPGTLSAPLLEAFGDLADRLKINRDLLDWRP
jgi:hypothetical protein